MLICFTVFGISKRFLRFQISLILLLNGKQTIWDRICLWKQYWVKILAMVLSLALTNYYGFENQLSEIDYPIMWSWYFFPPVGLSCSTSIWEILLHFIIFFMFDHYFLKFCSFIMQGRKWTQRRGKGEKLGGMERRGTIIRLYCKGNESILNKNDPNSRKIYKDMHLTMVPFTVSS